MVCTVHTSLWNWFNLRSEIIIYLRHQSELWRSVGKVQRAWKGFRIRSFNIFLQQELFVWNTSPFTKRRWHDHMGSPVACLVLFCFVYDYGLWFEDPSWDCLMAPIQSVSTSIGLASGRVIPLKNLPYSCSCLTHSSCLESLYIESLWWAECGSR